MMYQKTPEPTPTSPRKSVMLAIAACVTCGTTVAVMDLPVWVRAAGGAVALLAAILGVAVVWPTVRDMIHGRDA